MPTAPPSRALPRVALALGIVAAAIIPINFLSLLRTRGSDSVLYTFVGLALAQLVLGMVSGVLGLLHFSQLQKGSRGAVMVLSILGMMVGLGGLVAAFFISAIVLVGGSH